MKLNLLSICTRADGDPSLSYLVGHEKRVAVSELTSRLEDIDFVLSSQPLNF